MSRWSAAELAPVITLFVVVGFFAAFFQFQGRSFLDFGTLEQILRQGAALAICAAGLTFVLLCAEIDLSVGTMALFAACLCGVMFELDSFAGPKGKQTLSAVQLATVVAVPLAVCVFLGLVSGVTTNVSRLPSFIITLAMLNICMGLSKYITLSKSFKVPDALRSLGNGAVPLVDSESLGSLSLPYNAMAAGVVLFVGHLILKHFRFGRHVYMTGGNREAARLAGVRTGLVVTGCLGICALTAGMAGLINAGRLGSVTIGQNSDLLLEAVACVVLGGTSLFGGEGGMGRTLLGVLTYTTLKVGLVRMDVKAIENFDHLRAFVLGAILLLALLVNGRLQRRPS